jgi:hypothetical protein
LIVERTDFISVPVTDTDPGGNQLVLHRRYVPRES